MPTSHGSLLFKGAGPVADDSVHVARLRAAGAVPVGKTAAPEFGTLNFTKTKVVRRHPQPVGHRAHARRLDAGAARRRWPPGWSRSPRPATAAARPASRPAFCGSGRVQAQPRPHPAPGPDGLADRRCSGCSPPPWPTAPATSTSPPGPTTATASRCRRRRSRYEQADRVAARRGPAGAVVGRPRASPAVDPEVRGARRGGGRARWPTRPGLVLDDEPVALTDPVRTWLSGGALDLWLSTSSADMWPGVADDLTRYARSVARADRGLPAAQGTPASIRRREQLDADVAAALRRGRRAAHAHDRGAGLRGRGPPPDRSTASRPPAGAWPRRSRCWPTCAGTRRCRCRPASPPTGSRSGLQIIGRRHRDEVAAAPGAASSSRRSPGPATPPIRRRADVAATAAASARRAVSRDGSRRKRSTSSTSESAPGPSSLVGVVALLELGDVVGRLVVLLDQLGDLALVGRGRDLEVGRRHPHAEQLGRALDQRQRRLGRRGGRARRWGRPPTATPTAGRPRGRRRAARRRSPVGPS